MGRELGITPQTAQRWLAMLRSTFQWFEVPAYHVNTVKRISGRPTRQDTRGFEAFRTTYPKLKVAPGLVIAPVEKLRRLSEMNYCLPWDCR